MNVRHFQNIFFYIFKLSDPVVVECGDGWFSKIDGTRVNAKQICRDHEYGGKITEYGGNWGVQCVHGSNGAGGSLTAFGPAVSWKCDVDGKLSVYVPGKAEYRFLRLLEIFVLIIDAIVS